MSRNKTKCDGNRPTAEFDRFEFKGGRLIVGCKCTRNDGMQHECERLKCMADRPLCLTYPAATCYPSRSCPPRPPNLPQNNGNRHGSGAASQPVVGGIVSGGIDGGGAFAGGTGGKYSAGHDAGYRRFKSRQMRKWATDQYDDRPALRKFFQPCHVHCAQYRRPVDVCIRDAKEKFIL